MFTISCWTRSKNKYVNKRKKKKFELKFIFILFSIRTNDDQLTPLHQASSEGHVQCLEFLLSNDANVYAEDSRKQLPIDLAKLWGNKKCAKLLAAAMWHQNKHLSAKERLLSRNTKMADLLLEIKREHAILFEEKSEVMILFF
jgi:ankyrin repeat protein